MKISLILAHPNKASFNHAIAEAALAELREAGHEVVFHDLYAEGFDPILPHAEFTKDAALPDRVRQHCTELAEAEGIAIVHPNWWGQPPAILKGWVDRVIRPGVAYEFLEGDKGDGVPVGLLRAEAVIVFNTSDTPTEREREVFGDPLETLWKKCVFGLCGAKVVHRRMFSVVVTSTAAQRREWLEEVRDTVRRCFPAQRD